MPEKPAMAPWTAFCARMEQYTLSKAFAGTDRIMYVGSINLMVSGCFSCLKNLVIWSFKYSPTSANRLFPPASVSPPDDETMVSPQPSATTMTACPFCFMSTKVCASTFSRSMSISGSRQMSTKLAAIVEFSVMWPQCRPMSFTMPMQFAFEIDSTYADCTALSASVQAVSKPKVWSIIGTSLSIVFGTPMTAHSWSISRRQSKVCMAPL
mmetsp:Transcript_22311/g.76376  ORF Transcript_22311/g.76376 Transcript_22311/m.76376 type:complete len:210 (-) Transcript_22311:4218-4847(-)